MYKLIAYYSWISSSDYCRASFYEGYVFYIAEKEFVEIFHEQNWWYMPPFITVTIRVNFHYWDMDKCLACQLVWLRNTTDWLVA